MYRMRANIEEEKIETHTNTETDHTGTSQFKINTHMKTDLMDMCRPECLIVVCVLLINFTCFDSSIHQISEDCVFHLSLY